MAGVRRTKGKMMPPMGAPQAATLSAKARRLSKYADTKVTHGVNSRPLPMPWTIPWARMSCQYWLIAEVVKTPSIWNEQPTNMMERKWPLSMSDPERVPSMNSKNKDNEPTHAICDSVAPSTLTQCDSKRPNDEK